MEGQVSREGGTDRESLTRLGARPGGLRGWAGMDLTGHAFPAHCPHPSHTEPPALPIAPALSSPEKSGDHFLKTLDRSQAIPTLTSVSSSQSYRQERHRKSKLEGPWAGGLRLPCLSGAPLLTPGVTPGESLPLSGLLFLHHEVNSSPSAGSGLAAAASAAPGNSLEMCVLRPHPRPLESGIQGSGGNSLFPQALWKGVVLV